MMTRLLRIPSHWRTYLFHLGTPVRRHLRASAFVAALLAVVLVADAHARSESGSADNNLVRLAEILGAVHHLREVCGANEGQLWRGKMQELLRLERPDDNLKELMVSRFNRAYHQHRQAYPRCTVQARSDIDRFLDEGAGLSGRLAAQTGS